MQSCRVCLSITAVSGAWRAEDELKGCKSLFSIPTPPTSPQTSQSSPPLCFSQPISALPCPAPAVPSLGPGPQHVTEAVQLQRISCSLRRPGGLSLQRGRKSKGMAKVWWHKKSLGKQLQGWEHRGFICDQWKGVFIANFTAFYIRDCLIYVLIGVAQSRVALFVIRAQDICV